MKLEQIGAGGILARLAWWLSAGCSTVLRKGAVNFLEVISQTGLTTFRKSWIPFRPSRYPNWSVRNGTSGGGMFEIVPDCVNDV